MCNTTEAANEATCCVTVFELHQNTMTTGPVQLCVFDTKRDYPEGEEGQQIVAYHPEASSISDQTAVMGLA